MCYVYVKLSFNDLNGRSLAACQSIINGQCAGLISFCCSITRDRLSASETYVSRAALNMQSSVPVGGGSKIYFVLLKSSGHFIFHHVSLYISVLKCMDRIQCLKYDNILQNKVARFASIS